MKPSSKILIVGPSWVGDMVMAQSLFIALKELYPACRIDVLAPLWAFALLEKMPEVTHAIAMPLQHGQLGLVQRYQLGRQLRVHNYDQAIVLPNSWKSALIPFFANIPLRTGYSGEYRYGLLNDIRWLDKKLLPMTVQRFVALGYFKSAELPPKYPVPAIVIENDQQQTAIQKFQLTATMNVLALCPGAEYGSAKRWPADYYAKVAQRKITEGWQVWLFGSEKDAAITEQINYIAGHGCVDLAGRTSLAEAVELMSLASIVISNDSGLMHIAAALNKKIIALYGSSDPKFTPPLSKKAKVFNLNLDCAPCFKRDCPLYPPDHKNHTQCLTEIRPDRILDYLGAIH